MPEIKATLWLQPRPGTPLYEALQQTIDGLTPLFEDATHFEPHVTLTSSVSVSRQSEVDKILDEATAAATSVPITVTFNGLTYGTSFYRKVMLGVHKSPELVSLAMICREWFVNIPNLVRTNRNYQALPEAEQKVIQEQAKKEAVSWVQDFTPHLSLVYSNVYTVDEASRRTIDSRLQDVFGETYATRGIGWSGGRISLVECDLEVGPQYWQVLGYRDF